MSRILLVVLTLGAATLVSCSRPGEKYTWGAVRGRVYDRADGSGIQGATVSGTSFHGNPPDSVIVGSSQTSSDSRGGYRLTWGWLGGGGGTVVTRVHVTAAGYAPRDTSVSVAVRGTRPDNDAVLDLPATRLAEPH
jgi:hypothetical protein